MDEREVLDDLLGQLAAWVHEEVAACSPADLAWQPDPLANSAGVTVWHFTRWLDVLATQVFAGQPAAAELWQREGWAARTGYDPRGIGYLGLGAVTDYTPEEVAAVPILPAPDLLAYVDQVISALRAQLRATSPADLHAPAVALGGRRTRYEVLRNIVAGSLGHCGEIAALNALRRRATGAAATSAAGAVPVRLG